METAQQDFEEEDSSESVSAAYSIEDIEERSEMTSKEGTSESSIILNTSSSPVMRAKFKKTVEISKSLLFET